MSPCFSGHPWKSLSLATLRPSPKMIVNNRSDSSTADGTRSGSATIGVERRMLSEVLEQVTELGASGVEAGEDQDGQHVEYLVVGQSAVPNLAWMRCDARSPGASLGLTTPLGECRHPVVADAVQRRDHRLDTVGIAAEAVEEVLDPWNEAIGVGCGTADHRQEHLRRIAKREPGDEVALSGGHEFVQQPAADLACHGSTRSTDPGENQGLRICRYVMWSGVSTCVGTNRRRDRGRGGSIRWRRCPDCGTCRGLARGR